MSLMHTFFAKEQISSTLRYFSISNRCFGKKTATAFAVELQAQYASFYMKTGEINLVIRYIKVVIVILKINHFVT